MQPQTAWYALKIHHRMFLKAYSAIMSYDAGFREWVNRVQRPRPTQLDHRHGRCRSDVETSPTLSTSDQSTLPLWCTPAEDIKFSDEGLGGRGSGVCYLVRYQTRKLEAAPVVKPMMEPSMIPRMRPLDAALVRTGEIDPAEP